MIHEGDKEVVSEILSEACRKIMSLIEGDFVNEIEIELVVDEKTFLLTLKEK